MAATLVKADVAPVNASSAEDDNESSEAGPFEPPATAAPAPSVSRRDALVKALTASLAATLMAVFAEALSDLDMA